MPGRKDIEAGDAFVRLSLKDSALVQGLARNGERLKNFGKGMATVGAGIITAGASILGPLLGAVKVFADTASTLDDMAQRTGVSVEALSELGHAAEMSGTDLGTVEKAVMKMQKTRGKDLSKGTIASLKELGLNAEELQKQNPEQQFDAIAKAVGKIDDPTKRAAKAMEFFGKSGTALLPVIADMENLRQEARDLGYVMSTDSAKTGAALGDMFDNLWKTVKYGVVALGDALGPAVLFVGGVIQKVATKGLKWIQANKQLVLTIAAVAVGVIALGTAVTVLGLGIAGAGIVLSGLAAGLSAIGGIVGTIVSPLGLIAGLLVAGVYLWANYTESGKNALGGLSSFLGTISATIGKTLGGIYDALAAGDLSLAGEIALAGLRLVLLQGIDSLSNTVGGAFGDFIGTIGTEILSGDLSGAWQTMLEGLSALTADFVQGSLDTWTYLKTSLYNVGIELWANLQKVFNSGVAALVKTVLTLADAYLAFQEVLGTDTKAGRFVLGVGRGLIDGQTELANRAVDTVAGAAKIGVAGMRETEFSSNQADRDAKIKSFRDRTAGGAAGASSAVAQAQADLDKANAAAAAAKAEADRKAAEDKKKAEAAGEEAGIGSLSKQVFSTFSAEALRAVGQGQGNSPADRTARATEAMKKKLDEQTVLTQEQTALLRTGLSFT